MTLLLALTLLLADPVPVDKAVEGVAAARKEKAAAAAKEEAAFKVLREALAALNAKLKEIGVDPLAPTPPEPAPPPKPVDPLVVTLRAAYAADVNPADPAKKREALADLIEVYRQAGPLAMSADLATVSAVIGKVKAAAGLLGLTPTDLVATRKLIAAELLTTFPADAALDADGRARLAAAFGRIHGALSGVGP